MKKRIYLFLLSLNAFHLYSQVNLVPNPSFETISNCFYGGGAIVLGIALPWDSPSNGSSDVFNTCSIDVGYKIPSTGLGYQQAHYGNSFSGFSLYSADEFKEYLQVPLNSILIAGKNYCVSFYVNLADSSRYAVSNIGMHFSDTSTYINTQNYLNFTPQIENTTIITDTAHWTLISGQYTALGGELFIIIGNFFPDNLTNHITINNNSTFNAAYYFVDDVSVFEVKDTHIVRDTTICHRDSVEIGVPNYEGVTYSWQPTAGLSNATMSNPKASPLVNTTYYLTETTPCSVVIDTFTVSLCGCTVGINELRGEISKFQLVPNPNDGAFIINLNKEYKNVKIEITDVLGKDVYTTIAKETKQINVSINLPQGVYFISVLADGNRQLLKLIKQ